MVIFVRSLLFYIVGFSTVILAAALLLLTFWAPYRIRWAICVRWCRFAVWAVGFFCGMKVVVEGAENLPDVPSVIMIKHTTVLETLWPVGWFPQTAWVLKREILLMPLLGWAIGLALDPIAINRNSGGSAVRQVIRQGKRKLANGVWVTIFPEGTRMAPGETRRYGSSAAALANEANVPVVPVAHNAGDFWPRHSFSKQPGTVRFCIGPSIDGGAQSPRETNDLVQDWIETRMLEISSAYQNKNNDETDHL